MALSRKKRKPSEVDDDYWIDVESKKKNYPKPTENCGKWLVFAYLKDIDEVWDKISKSTEKGELGNSSKCATVRLNPNATNPDTKVICVYTYDSEDKEDVARVAWKLHQLGAVSVSNVLNYKKDMVTLEGKYTKNGDKRVSRYSIHITHFQNKTKEEFFTFFKEKYKD